MGGGADRTRQLEVHVLGLPADRDPLYIDEQAVWALMRFSDEPAERVPSQQITRVHRDDPRGSASIEQGEFDRELDRLNQEQADQ